MRLDRTKHNKFVTGAVYGNTTSGGITPSSSTAPVVGGGGSTVIIQGGGGSQEPVELGLGDLTNVGAWANEAATEDRFLVQVEGSNQWIAKPISDIIGDGEGNAYNKLDNDYFDKLFVAIDANGNEIDPNDSTTEIASIKARYGFWTEHFISVKGTSGDSDTDNTPYSHLHELRDVHLSQPVYNGQMLVYRNGYWVNETVQTGGSVSEEDLIDYAKKSYVDSKIDAVNKALDNKVDCAFFAQIFSLIDEYGNPIDVNDVTTIAKSIKANYGLWTEEFLSAYGYNPENNPEQGGGTGGIDKEELLEILEEEGYAKLEDIPEQQEVPTKVSQLENDRGYINETEARQIIRTEFGTLFADEMGKWFAIDEVTGAIYPVDDRGFFSNSFISALGPNNTPGSGEGTGGGIDKDELLEILTQEQYAKLTDIPVNVSEFTNDVGYITDSYLDPIRAEITEIKDDVVDNKNKLNQIENSLQGKLDSEFFARAFDLIGEDDKPIEINTYDQVAKSIRANLGLWTEQYLSALGNNSSGETGGGEEVPGSVTLEDDILVTTTVGYYSNGNVIKKGTSWEEIFRKMLYKATPATFSGKISTSTDLEIGSTKGTLTYTTYRNDSGVMTDAYYDENTENKLSFSVEDSSGKQTATRKLVGQHTARETYKATVVFAANEELEVPQQTLTSTISVNVYRKWFAGIVDVVPTTSAEVRNLDSNGLYKGTGTYSFNIGKWKNFVICIPSGEITSLTLTAYPGNFVEDKKTCNYIGTIMVEGANGYTASEYKMWQIKTAGENDADKFTFKTNG